jgi:hypothetical protein
MGFVYSHDVNATAYQGPEDEIAIAINHGILLASSRLFSIVIHFFLTEPGEGKLGKTKKLISEVTHAYLVNGFSPEAEEPFSKDIAKVSSACAWSLTLFCLFHEIGHVLKGHFLDCHNKSSDIRTIYLQPSQELEADEFALGEWLKYHKPFFVRKDLGLFSNLFSKEDVEFDPDMVRVPLATFLPISVDTVFTLFQLLDRLPGQRSLSHPLWRVRKEHIRNCVPRRLSRRQRGVLSSVEKLIH